MVRPMPFEEEDAAESRRERRWNIPVQVTVKGTREDGTDFNEQTITTDASPGGMCLLLSFPLEKGDRVTVTAQEEGFESSATVSKVSPLGPNMNRVRIMFTKGKIFSREKAARRYFYDFELGNWVGYTLEGVYYNTKHEPFGKVEGSKILALDSGAVLFNIRSDRAYNEHGLCIGHII